MKTRHLNPIDMRSLLKRASHQEVQRALDLTRLTCVVDLQLAENVLEQFGDEREALRWLWTPHGELEGDAPLQAFARPGGRERVLTLLARLAGVVLTA